MKTYKIAFILFILSVNYTVYSQCDGVNTFTDARDARVYNMIQIDGNTAPYCAGTSQCWMAENLNVGQQTGPLNEMTDAGSLIANQDATNIEKYCHGGVSGTTIEGDCSVWGGLYQWNEMMAYGASVGGNGPGPRGICPVGWHVPTDNEWRCMEMNLGMAESETGLNMVWRGTDQGDQLKQAGLCQGRTPCGTSNFDAILSGGRTITPTFYNSDSNFDVWAATESSSTHAWRRSITHQVPGVYRMSISKEYGYAVRCVRDNAPWPLPVELLYFRANWTDNNYETVTLDWETITESENSHFEIERSTDAINFEYVKSIDGSGTSNQNIQYTTLDATPYTDGTSYYRLKQVDHNGDFEYSNIEVLNIPEGINMVNLYPNPTVDHLTVLLTSSEDTETTISIKNNLGQEVRLFNQKVNKGFNSINFSFSELSTGNYTIQISTTSGLYKVERKFIKANQ